MSSESSRATGEPLRFDRVVVKPTVTASPSGDDSASPGIVCSRCRATVRRDYYQVDGAPTCGPCSEILRRDGSLRLSVGLTTRAGLFGLGAAVVGAIIYYGVIALADLEIGIIAILTGYIVGWAVRRGAGGRGARRLQVMAVALTYFSVGLAYTPLVLPSGDGSVLLGIGSLLLLVFILPATKIASSMPGGLISAAIIFFGLHQAWRMTRRSEIVISGPYRVGAEPETAST